MTSPVQWQTLKTNARWKAGQSVTSPVGESLDGDGLGALHRLDGDGPAWLRLRFVPGDVAGWTERARKVSVLGHPNVVPVVGVGASEGRSFLVEERPEGESLRRWITRSPKGHPPLRDVERVLGAVLAALRHAHDVSVFHGGLSAACVGVAKDGVGNFDVRVGGFGLLHTFRDRRATLSPELCDSLCPELTDDAKAPDAAADAYAFGVLLVECLSGSLHPHGTRHAWRELAATPEVLRRRLGEAREGIPKSLWDLAAGLLAGEPTARTPKTARDLARSLQRQTWELEEVITPAPPPRRADPVELAPAAPMGPAVAKVMSVSTRRVTEAPAVPSAPSAATPPVIAPSEEEAPSTTESPAAAPPTEEMPAAHAVAATLVDAEPARSSVPRTSPSKPTPPPPLKKAPPPPPPAAGTATLLDEDVPHHHDDTGTLPIGGADGAATLAYEDDSLGDANPLDASGAQRSPFGSTQVVKRAARVAHRSEEVATLPIGVRVDDATTTPRIRPSRPSAEPPPSAPAPTPRAPAPPPQVATTMPDAGSAPTPAPAETGDIPLSMPVMLGVAVVVVATMGVLGWLAAWVLRP